MSNRPFISQKDIKKFKKEMDQDLLKLILESCKETNLDENLTLKLYMYVKFSERIGHRFTESELRDRFTYEMEKVWEGHKDDN